MDDESSLRASLVAAVRAAGRICRDVRNDLQTDESVVKSDESPVTVADLASQAVVSRALSAGFPDVPLAAEEDASTLAGGERAALRAAVLSRIAPVWPGASETELLDALDRGRHPGGPSGRFFVLDPIDGTKGFLRGDHYAVALALVEDGRVVAGALACPRLDRTGADGAWRGVVVHAVRGRGTLVAPLDEGAGRDLPTRVSAEADVRRARLCEPVESGHSDRSTSARVRERLAVSVPPVRMDSQAKYALLALGGGEVYLRTPTREDRREWIWDHAAGAIVVEEAGGRVTDAAGAPLDFSRGRRLEANRGILATNGVLHEAILSALG